MATPLHAHTAPERFGALLTAQDRTRAFRSARRHSAMVRVLKLGMPIAAVAVAGLYILPSQLAIPIAGGKATVEAVDLTIGGLKMVNPRIKGVNDKYGAYDIRADSSVQKVTETDVMTFDKINADIVSKEGQKTTLTAPSGIFHSKKEELTFDNGVLVDGQAGISGKLKTATAFMKENRLISNDPVTVRYHGHQVDSDSVVVYTAESRVIFTGRVRVHLERAQVQGGQK